MFEWLVLVSWIGIRKGTWEPIAGLVPIDTEGATYTGHDPEMQLPLQHVPPLHGPLGMHATDAVQRWFTQSIGARQSPCVSQTPPSTGFWMHMPYWPNEQHCASAVQEE